MNHQEQIELISLLAKVGVNHFKSHDLELSFGISTNRPTRTSEVVPPTPAPVTPEAVQENKDATEKLKGLIETLKMDDAALLDTIFPAGAGG